MDVIMTKLTLIGNVNSLFVVTTGKLQLHSSTKPEFLSELLQWCIIKLTYDLHKMCEAAILYKLFLIV